MFGRKREGSVVCPSCGSLVGVNDEKCYMCGRANPSLWGFAPLLRRLGSDMGFVPLVIGVSVTVYLLTLLVSGSELRVAGGLFGLLSPSPTALFLFGASGAAPVFGYGAWWTLLSATWLHGSALHILFNMMWIRNIGPATADILGPGRTIIIYVLSGVCGFLLSSVLGAYFPYLPFFGGGTFTVGASASLFGLFGALLHYGQKSGSSLIRAQVGQWALGAAVYGFLMPGIDNSAHLGGFIGGYLLSSFFNPLTKERGDHLIGAAICLVASFLAIAFSLVRWLLVVSA
jgi:rhomboid protease GluP